MNARSINNPDFTLRLKQPLRGGGIVASVAELPPIAANAKSAPSDQHVMTLLRERLFTEIARLRAQWQDDAARRLDQTRELAVELSLAIAAQFLHREITRGEFPFETLARQMIDRLGHEGPVQIRLHPEDFEFVQKRLGEKPLLEHRGDVQLFADADLARGDCRVEGDGGVVMSDLAERLADVRVQVMRSLGHAGD